MTSFLVLLFAYTLSQFYRAFLAIVAGDLSRDIGLGAADLGAISAAWFIAFALAQFPVGYALDRFGPRRTMAGFMVAAVLGAAWLASATTYEGCVGAMALIGIGCSPILMASMYLFARVAPPERFAMLSSFMIGFGAAGNLLGATPLALAVEAFGWRTSMGGIAGVTAFSALLVVLILRDPPRADDAPGGAGPGGLRQVVSIRPLWLLLPLTFVSYAVVIAMRSLWIAPFFGEVHGLGATARGHAALVMAAAMSLGALAYGPLERLIGGAKRTTLIGSVVTGVVLVALGVAGEESTALAVALVAAVGGAGMTYGILMAHARQFFPVAVLGRGVTFMNFAFIAGAGVVQWASGLAVQAAQNPPVPPASIFGGLHLAFGVPLLLATAVYALAPARPRPVMGAALGAAS